MDRKKKYENKRIQKSVSFNLDKDQDKKRLEFIKAVDFSIWVKSKIDEELNLSK